METSHRESTQLKRKVAPKATQEKAINLVNKACVTCAGPIIRQHLDI